MSAGTRGAIYHHKSLIFHNGIVGRKYLVLLNTPGKDEPYLFVKTTSQQKNRQATPGCIEKRSLFFIPGRKTFFKLDTWLQLYEIYEMSREDVVTNQDVTFEGSLDEKMIEKIVDCLFTSEEDNLIPFHKKLIRPPIQDAIFKLKAKFEGGKRSKK